MSTTHIAGIRITVCHRVIQRCSLCGEKLMDNVNCAMPRNEDGSIPEFPTWEVGRLIRVTEGNWTLLEDTDKLPDDSCLDLVE